MSLKARFRTMPKQVQFMIIIVAFFVSCWFFITPIYDFIKHEFEITPWVSVIIGGVLVFIIVKKWRLHPW